MSSDQTECDIHLEYDKSCYDGDFWSCITATFSSPDTKKIATISYDNDYESEKTTKDQFLKDVLDFMKGPEEWIEDHIRKGPDNVQKLRQLERDAMNYQKEIENYEGCAATTKAFLQKKQEAIATLKAKMEEQANASHHH